MQELLHDFSKSIPVPAVVEVHTRYSLALWKLPANLNSPEYLPCGHVSGLRFWDDPENCSSEWLKVSSTLKNRHPNDHEIGTGHFPA